MIMANGGSWDAIPGGEPVCIHGVADCTCLDDLSPAGKWQPAIQMVTTVSTQTASGGNTWIGPPNGTSAPSPWIGGAISPTPWVMPPGIQPMTGVDIPDLIDECEQGHYIDEKTIRCIIEDDEEQIVGRCLFCDDEIFIPRIVGALSFEKAGAAVGRAMTLHDGDDEKVGELLADLSKLKRDTQAEIARCQRALGMLEIARDLCEQRAIKGLAETAA